jgi:hypothetical protein
MASVRPNPATTTKSRTSAAAGAAETFEIPMNRVNPLWFVVVVLGLVAVVGAIMFARRPASTKAPEAEKEATPAQESKEEIAARREHMEITKKSIAAAAEAPAPAAAAKPAEPATSLSSPTPVAAAAPAARSTQAGAAVAAAEPAAAAKPVAKPPPRKQLDALDRMGDDLAGQLK